MNNKIGVKVISSILLGTMCIYTMPVLANTKDETVYSKINNSGKNYSTIVSTKLSNDNNSELIDDLSDLLKIENTNGEETFKQDGNKIVWKANGNNIQYQGESQKELPITCNVRYELNGEEVEAKDIVGKDGKVKVIIEYTNNEVHTVKVNGKYVKMYTPFVVVAGTLIDNTKNSNIEISNGKMLDNGTKTTVIGMAMPGLQESLNISTSKLNIPSSIEISMDAKEFEMNNIISYATPKVLESDDLKLFDNLDEIYNKVNELQSSSKQLVDGAKQVNDGANQVNTGANTLKNGINTAYIGASTIKTTVAKSTNSLINDKSDALDKDTLAAIGTSASKTAGNSLNQKDESTGKTSLELIGLQASNEANNNIKNQETAIKGSASNAAQKELNSINSTTKTTNLEAIGLQASNTATEDLNSIDPTTNITKLEEIGLQAESQITSVSFTDEQKAIIIAKVDAGLEADEYYKSLTNEQKALIKGYSEKSAISVAESSAIEVAKKTAKQVAQNVAKELAGKVSYETAKQVAKQVANSVAGDTAYQTALTIAQQVANQTAQGTALTVAQNVANQTATSVAEQVANQVKGTALKQVASQMKALSDGLEELTGGLLKINSGASELTAGTNKLAEGANALDTGMSTFDSEGIEKICNYINGDLKDLTSRADALKDLANDYKTFTALNDGDNGTVKFITIIDSVKKENFIDVQNVNSNNNITSSNNETTNAQNNKEETAGTK